MNSRARGNVLKKGLIKSVSLLLLSGSLAISAPSPAQAMVVTVALDPIATAIHVAEHAYTVATDFIKEQEVEWGAAIAAANTYLQAQMATMLNDNINANGRNTSNLQVLQNKAADKLDRSGYNACAVQNSAAKKAADKRSGHQMAAASMAANITRPNTPTQNATELNWKCEIGLINTNNPGDPDSAQYVRLFGPGKKCTPPAGAAAKEGSDRNIANVVHPLEYFVPDNFPNTVTDGNYQALPASLKGCKGDCSPFVAAYTFCQNVTPTIPIPSQSTGSATPDDSTAGQRRNEQSRISSILACYDAVWARGQFPASNPMTDIDPITGKTTTRHQIQADRCQDDFADKILSPAQNAICQTDGRSDVQADHDRAYRLGPHSNYQTEVLSTVTDIGQQEMLKADAWQAETKFEADRQTEMQNILAAMSVAKSASPPGNSTLNMTVK